jgi:alpha-amylase/alpha-mannosidase (GH57 family)
VAERTRWCDFEPLITTATDGENGGWFRNVTEGANFWSAFYLPMLQRVREDAADVRPSFISDYLDQHGAHGEVRVATGAWNTGWHHGKGFTQWTGSDAQKRTLARYAEVSSRLRATARRAAMAAPDDAAVLNTLEEARWRLLRAETSCNIFWGEAWVDRATGDLDAAVAALDDVERRLLET